MPRTLGTSAPAVAPPAVRVARPGWRDPRLWIGVALVAACVVAGARLLGSADDTVEAWAVTGDHAAGDVLTADDLEVTRVRFADPADLGTYYAVTDELPEEVELVGPVGAGELLPRSAVGEPGRSGLRQLPLSVDPGQVPPSVGVGSVVDVYVLSPAAEDPGGAAPVLEGVAVVADVPPTESFSATGLQQLTVAVPEDAVGGFFGRLGRADDATITVVRRS